MSDTSELHRQLLASLEAHLRSRSKAPMVFTEVALDDRWGVHGRLDVATVATANDCSVTKLDGYEVKASKADLRADLNQGKWRRYLNTLHHLSFAFPSGMVATEEIPEVCGIIVYLSAKGTWRWIRRPRALDGFGDGPDSSTWLRLLRRSYYSRPPEDRLDRMRRLAEVASDQELAAGLSRRFRAAQSELKLRRMHLEAGERALEERRSAEEGAGELLEAIECLLAHASHSLAGGHGPWARQERTAIRRALVEMAENLERRVVEARTQDRGPAEALG